MAAVDRPSSDGDESDGPEDEENDAEEEDEEDSQAESSLSATPSVSASPQHVPSAPASVPPSALLAQMSLSSSSPPPAPTTDCQTSDTESVTMMSPISPCRQMSIDYPDSEVPATPPSDAPPKPSRVRSTISFHARVQRWKVLVQNARIQPRFFCFNHQLS